MTTIEKNPSVEAMRAMALALLPQMSWRHHGIGCLQGYLTEDRDPEVRLHIWSHRLLKPGMEESGDIHDHRFDLVSHVLAGVVGHMEVIPELHDYGEWRMMALTHARAAKDTAYHGPTQDLPGKFAARFNQYVIETGLTYGFPAGRFHRSPLVVRGNNVAVTCVEKHRQKDVSARLLYPAGKSPVMAFGHERDMELVGSIVQAARRSLESPL